MRGNGGFTFQLRFDDLGQLLAQLHSHLIKDQSKAVQETFKKDIANGSQMTENNILHWFTPLNPREYEISTYVITGLLNKQIAYVLSAGKKTVKVRRVQVMGKLEMSSVTDLVRLAEKAGIEPAQISDI